MGMEELSSDSEDGSGQPSHIARYEQWLEQKATRPPSPPPPPRTSESRTGLAKEPASSTTNSGPAEEQPGKVPTRTLACLHDGTCNPTVGSCSLLPTHPLGCQGRLKGRQQPRSAQHRPAACGDTDVSDAAQAGRRDGRDGGGGSRIPFQARVPEHPRELPREDKSTDIRDEVRPDQLHGHMQMQVGMWIRYQCWGAGERERRMAGVEIQPSQLELHRAADRCKCACVDIVHGGPCGVRHIPRRPEKDLVEDGPDADWTIPGRSPPPPP